MVTLNTSLARAVDEPETNRPFPVHDPGVVWFVTSGKLDVFLVRLENGEAVGARHHVLRVEEGGAIFGLPAIDGGFGLCAVAGLATRTDRRSRDEVRPEVLQTACVRWVKDLAGATGAKPIRADIAPDWTALDQFHQSAVGQLVSRHERTAEEEQRRLRARPEEDAQIRHGALQQLAEVPVSGAQGALSGASSNHPLVQACEAVGRAAGTRLSVPRSAIAGQSKDPARTIARYSGVRTRRLVLKGEWWKQDSGPLLAFVEADGRPVALLPRRRRGYDAYDPDAATTTRVTAEVAQSLTGIAHGFYRPFPAKSLTLSDLVAFGLRSASRDLVSIVAAGLVMGALGVVTPLVLGIVFDTVIPGAQRGQLVQIAVLLLANAVAVVFFGLVRSLALLRLEGKMDFATQAAVWDRLLRLPTRFFRDYSAGDLALRSLAITQIHAAVTGSALSAILSAVFSCFSFFLLFYYSPALALLATGLVTFAVAVTLGCSYLNLKHQRTMSAMAGRISGMVLEIVNGAAKFRVSGAEDRAFSKWAAAFAEQKRTAARARRLSNILAVFGSTFPVIATGVLFYGIATMSTQPAAGTMTTGEFLAFYAAFGQFLGAVLGLSSVAITLLQVVPLYERAKPILTTLPEVATGKVDPGELRGHIELAHVAFRYTADTPLVLRDLSLTIRPGELVAIVGPSGSGKSTMLRLLLGFESPESGSVYLDGKNLAGLDMEAVRRQMGVVLQHGKLMIGDIFNNIVGSAPLTLDDAWKAARMAGFDQDIKAMPMGMHTIVSEGGAGLSGGQRQRLMIARAIVGNPRILLFDEATSALDNRTQAIVTQALEGMDATRIVIAHRLSSVVRADRILVVEKGVLVQSGTYGELIEQDGAFAELALRQLV